MKEHVKSMPWSGQGFSILDHGMYMDILVMKVVTLHCDISYYGKIVIHRGHAKMLKAC